MGYLASGGFKLWAVRLAQAFLFLLPLLVVAKDPQTKSSRILVEPHFIDAEFRKAWMPFFCRSGHPVVTPEQFLDYIGHFLPQETYLDLPRITGRDLQLVARAKKSTGWLGTRLRHSRSLVWLFCWSWLRPPESGHRVFWMPFLPMVTLPP